LVEANAAVWYSQLSSFGLTLGGSEKSASMSNEMRRFDTPKKRRKTKNPARVEHSPWAATEEESRRFG
jgi:hypothetical protein